MSASTSMRSSPSLPATTLEPSLTTIRFTTGSLFGPARRPARAVVRLGGVELEGDAADLDLVARLEARPPEPPDRPDAPQPPLEVVHRVLVLDVVAREQHLDAAPPHGERAGPQRLDPEATRAGRPRGHVAGPL